MHQWGCIGVLGIFSYRVLRRKVTSGVIGSRDCPSSPPFLPHHLDSTSAPDFGSMHSFLVPHIYGVRIRAIDPSV
jgi:hypothetical protein